MISVVLHDREPAPESEDLVVSEFAKFHALTYQRTFRLAWRAAGRDEHTAYDAAQDAYTTMLANWSVRCSRSLADNRAYVIRIAFNKIEPFSSCVAVGFDVVQNEDGLHDCGGSAWAATELGQDLPGLERGDRPLAAGADLRVRLVHGLLPG